MVWDYSIGGENAQTLKGILCGRLESSVSPFPRVALPSQD